MLALLGAAAPAAAHPAPFSYLDVRLRGNSLEVSAVIHAYDVAYELRIEPIERVLDSGTLRTQSTLGATDGYMYGFREVSGPTTFPSGDELLPAVVVTVAVERDAP